MMGATCGRLGARRLALNALAGVLACAMLPGPASAAAGPKLTVEHVVMLMRHGVRPPTKDPAMPAGIAAEPWPAWSAPPGWLTGHGAEAVRLLGEADRAMLADAGVIASEGCPDDGAIALFSDSDQRTIATGDAWAQGLAPGCRIDNQHKPQKVSEPLFAGIGKDQAFDGAAAAIRADLGAQGVVGVERRQRRALQALDRILCGNRKDSCGVMAKPSQLEPQAGKKPKMEGALDLGSTAAQILLLEYAEGKPMNEVGWGRASAADIALVGSLHSSEFAITARTGYIAERSYRLLTERIRAALGEGGPKVTVFVGHDTTVASFGGLFGLHWTISGFAADDPAPGGALLFETVRDEAGHRFVRAAYRSQTLDQIRGLSGETPVRQALMFRNCGPRPVTLCPVASFERALAPKP